MGQKVPLETRETWERKEKKDFRDVRDRKESREREDFWVLLGHGELMEAEEKEESKVSMVVLEYQVCFFFCEFSANN